MAGNFFRGTTAEQDPRWGNAEKKLLDKLTKAGTFPPEYEVKIDASKCQMPVIEKWVTERMYTLLGFEDDIVTNLVINLLTEPKLDARKVHMALVGFLDKKTEEFVRELWALLADAQSNATGVPTVFLDKKKNEIEQRARVNVRRTRSKERDITRTHEGPKLEIKKGDEKGYFNHPRSRSRSRSENRRHRSRSRDRNRRHRRHRSDSSSSTERRKRHRRFREKMHRHSESLSAEQAGISRYRDSDHHSASSCPCTPR